MTSNPNKNFGLTEAEFMHLSQALREGDTTLFEQAFQHFFTNCIRLVRTKTQANHQQAYDATMEALLDMRRKIVRGSVNYGNLNYLFTTMACQQFWKAAGRSTRTISLEPTHLEVPDEAPQFEFTELTRQQLDEAWNSLNDNCKQLLYRNYFLGRSLKDIATQQGVKPATLRKQKQRCLEQLRASFRRK